MKLTTSMILLLISTITWADTETDVHQAIIDNFKHTQDEDTAAVMGDLIKIKDDSIILVNFTSYLRRD